MRVLTAKKATWRTLPPNVWENCKETLPSAAANLAVVLWVIQKQNKINNFMFNKDQTF
jgi:hypothetical protein